MKRLLLTAFFCLAILTACEKKQQETELQAETTTQKESNNLDENVNDAVLKNDDQHAISPTNLELDNGKKWKTNTEMLPFINEQEKLLKNYDDDRDDYKVLAANLNAANEKLIKSCTMKGKSHDVLHVWLANHMKNIEMLAKAANKEEADKFTEMLEHSMETYHQHFE